MSWIPFSLFLFLNLRAKLMPMSVTAFLATDQDQELIRLFYMLSVVFSYIFRIYLERERERERERVGGVRYLVLL